MSLGKVCSLRENENINSCRWAKRLTEVHLAIISRPARRETVGRVNVCKGDREVNEEEIKVFKAPEFQLIVSELLDVLLGVEGVPQLGSDDLYLLRSG